MPEVQPQYVRRNILTGQAALYFQPEDLDNPAAPPDDDEPLNFHWATPWTAVGATTEGVSITFARQATDIRIEEQSTPVDQKTTTAGFTVAATLAEDTLETMRLAYGGGTITTVAPGTGTPGVKKLQLSEDVEHFAIGLEGQAPPRTGIATPWRRIVIPTVTSVAEVATAYRRAEGQRTYPVSFSSLVSVTEIDIRELNAVAL